MQILTRSHNNTNTHGNGWMGDFCFECLCPTNVLHRKEGRKEGRRRKARTRRRERKKEGTATEREGERVKLTTVSSLELIQESVSCCLLRPLLTTITWNYSLIESLFLYFSFSRNCFFFSFNHTHTIFFTQSIFKQKVFLWHNLAYSSLLSTNAYPDK